RPEPRTLGSRSYLKLGTHSSSLCGSFHDLRSTIYDPRSTIHSQICPPPSPQIPDREHPARRERGVVAEAAPTGERRVVHEQRRIESKGQLSIVQSSLDDEPRARVLEQGARQHDVP